MLGYRLLLIHLTGIYQHSDRVQFVICSCYDMEFKTLFGIFLLVSSVLQPETYQMTISMQEPLVSIINQAVLISHPY